MKTDKTLGTEGPDCKPSPWEAGLRKIRNSVFYILHTELKDSLNCMRLYLKQRNKQIQLKTITKKLTSQ